jgi:type IV pilus assembly protein PilX
MKKINNIGTARVFHITAVPQQQKGATLIMGLVFLVILTVIGLASMDVTTIDVKVVANSKDRQLAFNAAESNLFDAAAEIRGGPGALDATNVGFIDDSFAGDTDWWATSGNWANVGNPNESDFVIETADVIEEPAINGVSNVTQENTGVDKVYHEYPVLSKALGPGGASVVLASQFLKKIEDNTK